MGREREREREIARERGGRGGWFKKKLKKLMSWKNLWAAPHFDLWVANIWGGELRGLVVSFGFR